MCYLTDELVDEESPGLLEKIFQLAFPDGEPDQITQGPCMEACKNRYTALERRFDNAGESSFVFFHYNKNVTGYFKRNLLSFPVVLYCL